MNLDTYLLKPSDKFFLVFPQGYVPLVVVDSDIPYSFIYDPVTEGALQSPLAASPQGNGITSLTIAADVLFGSRYITGNPNDVFKVDKANNLLQLFFGVAPSYTRVYIYQPANVAQGRLDVATWNSSYNQFGFIDGYQSPLNNPSPYTQIAVPYGLEVAFGLVNPTTVPISPLFRFVVNRMIVNKITNTEIVYDMFTRENTKKLIVGGASSYTINEYNTYGVTPINPSLVLNSTKDEALKVIKEGIGSG